MHRSAAAADKILVRVELGAFLRKLLMHRDPDFAVKMLQDHSTELFDCLDHLDSDFCLRNGKPPASTRYLQFVANEEAVLAMRYPETQPIVEAATRRHRAAFLFDYVLALDVPEDFSLFAGNVGKTHQVIARFNAQLVDSLLGNLEQLERFIFSDREEAVPHIAAFLSELMDLLKGLPVDKKMAVYRRLSHQRFKSCCQIFLKHHLQKPLGRDPAQRSDLHLFRDENPTEMIDLIVQFEEYSTFPYIC